MSTLWNIKGEPCTFTFIRFYRDVFFQQFRYLNFIVEFSTCINFQDQQRVQDSPPSPPPLFPFFQSIFVEKLLEKSTVWDLTQFHVTRDILVRFPVFRYNSSLVQNFLRRFYRIYRDVYFFQKILENERDWFSTSKTNIEIDIL